MSTKRCRVGRCLGRATRRAFQPVCKAIFFTLGTALTICELVIIPRESAPREAAP